MSPYLAAGVLVAWQAVPPAERLEAFLSQADWLSVRVSTTVNNSPTAAVGTATWHQGDRRQRFVVQAGPESREFIQDPDDVLLVNHTAKTYHDYWRLPVFAPMPPDDDLIAYGYPRLIAEGPGRSGKTSWKLIRSATAADPTDVLETKVEADGNTTTYTVTIDSMGRPIRSESVTETQMGQFRIRQTYSGYVARPPEAREIRADLPIGYVPDSIPVTARVLTPGDQLPQREWFNPSRERTEPRPSGWLVILVTSPDCQVSRGAEPAWKALREDLRRIDVQLAEVSFSRTAPNNPGRDGDRPLFTDPKGELERDWGISMTPYLLMVDPKGVIHAAFAGFGPGEQPRLLKTFRQAKKAAAEMEG